jgi:hypothetical protein
MKNGTGHKKVKKVSVDGLEEPVLLLKCPYYLKQFIGLLKSLFKIPMAFFTELEKILKLIWNHKE